MIPMHQLVKISLVASLAVSIIACKKSADEGSTTQEICIVGAGIRNGVVIDSQYIVLYKPSASDAQTITTQSADTRLNTMLRRNNLSSSRILTRFGGGRSGFIARINKDEAGKLAGDPMVERIEQDRIIALGSCFTVAAPTLLTWNVKKTGYGDGT